MASIRRMPRGTWQAVVRRNGYSPQFRTFQTQQDARKWARQVESEIDRAVFVNRTPSERVTMGELIDRYLKEIAPFKKSTVSLGNCLRFLKPAFAHYTLAALQAKDIAAYRDKRIASGRAGATVVKELNALSRVIDVASREWGYYVPMNPVDHVTRPAVARGRDRRLLPGEETRLLAACERSRSAMLASIVRLALETGMRMGELLVLDWRHIDLTKRVARLNDSKNGEGRDVPLSSMALATLRALPRHISNTRVFWTWSRSDSLDNAWRRALTHAGIENLHFHDLRHEAVSRFAERGLNVLEIAAVSGHKTLQMLKRYTHLKAEELACKLG